MIRTTQYSALVLERKEPFYEWLRQANQKAMMQNDNFFPGDHGTYLLKDVVTTEELHQFLEKNYLTVFENELGEWHEPALWPSDRNLEMFHRFFAVQLHRQVYQMH